MYIIHIYTKYEVTFLFFTWVASVTLVVFKDSILPLCKYNFFLVDFIRNPGMKLKTESHLGLTVPK